MILAVISDIHSNLEALTAVLAAIDERGVDAVHCLGDIVGYGADPGACVDLVRERCSTVVMGNHDDAVAHYRGIDVLPPDAQAAVFHNREHLSDEQRAYLADLPLRAEADGATFVHATPKNPNWWIRLESFLAIREQFDYFDTDLCFIGHSHVPAVMGNQIGAVRVRPGLRFLVNVGSVGQPRDGNPDACVGFLDTETMSYELARVPYDIEAAAKKIEDAGLPQRLGDRLFVGA